jgi:hypothetical protein
MVKCTRFGTLQTTGEPVGHQLVLIEADSVPELIDWPELPSQHFLCFVVWDAPSDDKPLVALARTVLDAGAVFVSTFGSGCERVHDAIDDAIVASERERDGDHVVVTTWHASETLEEALWFALFTASPATAYEATTRAMVVVVINAARYAEILRRHLADPQALSELVLA